MSAKVLSVEARTENHPRIFDSKLFILNQQYAHFLAQIKVARPHSYVSTDAYLDYTRSDFCG